MSKLLTVVVAAIIFTTTKVPSCLCDTSDNLSSDSGVEKLVINNKYETDEIFQENKNEGENIVLNCEFSPGPGHSPLVSFQWFHNGTAITETKFNARSYVATREKKDNKKVLMLVMRKLHGIYDNGLYECVVRHKDEDQELKRRVNLIVINPAYWTNTAKIVNATIGDSLVVNCDAKGNPKPRVDIELSNGSSLPSDFIVRSDASGGDVENTIFIKNITMNHRGVEIRCMASQVLTETDDNPVVVKIVTIDVFYKPSFVGGHEVKRYGILNSNLSIKCQIIDSNPPVTSFVFYELSKDPDNKEVKEEIKDGYRDYKVESFIETQTAALIIPMLNVSHFDEYAYECLARNKHNLEDTQKITLLQIQTPISPDFVDVTETEADDDTSVVWKLESVEISLTDSPVIKYRIKSVPEVDFNTTDWEEIPFVEFDKNARNLYKITGLNQNTRYAFRFQGINAAGEGDWSPIPCDKCTAVPRTSLISAANSMNYCNLWTFTVMLLAIFITKRNV